MPCESCGGGNNYYPLNKDCKSLKVDKCHPVDASCVYYTGANLPNLADGVENPSVETLLIKIDEIITTIGGTDYGSYNTYCLENITDQQSFVETISQAYCTLKSDFDIYVSTNPGTTDLQNQINAIVNPNLALCSFVNTTTASTLNEILTALADAACDLNDRTDIGSVDWDAIYTVINPPTTISGGFDEVIRQIGLLKASVPSLVTLPTFNTVSSCLTTKTTTTPLSTVVNELIQKACQLPIDYNALSWGCVDQPVNTDLTSVVNAMLSEMTSLITQIPVFDSTYFTVTSNGACLGDLISLDTSSFSDQGEVFASASSTIKGRLDTVLQEGTNISLDYSVPNKVIINSVDPATVKVKSTSTNAQYLFDAVQGGALNGMSVDVSEVADKVVLTPQFNDELFVDYILTTIQNNPTLMAKLCNMLCQCNDCGQ